MAVSSALQLHALDDRRQPLPAADTECGEAEPPALGLQVVEQRGDQARARAAQRVSERDGAAVRVELIFVDTERAHDRQRLCGEGLVQLDDVDVVEREMRSRERLARR